MLAKPLASMTTVENGDGINSEGLRGWEGDEGMEGAQMVLMVCAVRVK
jgi:hypothetical protein